MAERSDITVREPNIKQRYLLLLNKPEDIKDDRYELKHHTESPLRHSMFSFYSHLSDTLASPAISLCIHVSMNSTQSPSHTHTVAAKVWHDAGKTRTAVEGSR